MPRSAVPPLSITRPPVSAAGLDYSVGSVAATVTTSTFTGNAITASGSGAGLCVAENSSGNQTFTIQYSRIYGNTGGTFPGLSVGCTATTSTVNATESVVASNNWWGCNGPASGTNCDTAGNTTHYTGATLTLTPFTTLTLTLNSTTPTAGSSIIATGSLAQNSAGTIYSSANDAAYIGLPATISITQNNGSSNLTNTPSTTLTTIGSPSTYAGIQAVATASSAGTGSATVTVDGCKISEVSGSTNGASYACNNNTPSDFSVSAPDLVVTSAHSGNFKAGDTVDTYTLTVGNAGTASTSGTVTVTDTLPSGFTATALSGSGWTCTLSSLTCTSTSTVAASVTFPPITLTVSVSGSDAGTYTNSVAVSGGGEINTSNDRATDSTIVVGSPTISQAFSPTTVAPNATSTLTFTLGNPSANAVSLTGVAFADTFPSGLKITSTAATTCAGGTASGAVGATTVSLSGATIAAGATCTVTVGVASTAIGTYTSTSGTVTATNANSGGASSATLTVSVTPTRLVDTTVPATPIAAGGNAGAVSVALEDAAGNVATNNSGTTITLVVTGPGSYSQTYTASTTNGVATFNLSSVPLTTAGTYTYTASATSFTSAVATETVNPGAATNLLVTGLGIFTAPQMSGTATVRAVDGYGNTATAFAGTVTLTSSDTTATFSPASYTFTAGDNGSHAFTVTFNTAGTQTVTATSGSVAGSETGIAVEDAIWILNTTSTLARLTDAGVQTTSTGTVNGTATFGAVAFDNAGDVWTASNATNAILEYTRSGTSVTVPGNAGAGVNAPVSLFLDGIGQVWVANGNGTLSVLSNAGAAVSPSTGYKPATLSTPTGILVDNSGSVWVTSSGGNSVTKVFGAAAPVVTPTVTGTVNNALGARP